MRWRYEEIDYSLIKKEKVANNLFLFKALVIASFIEITSNVYEKNLVQFYSDNEKIVQWLENIWEKEELQHGKALKRYIQEVWSDFDWESAYERFLQEYLPHCTLDEFQPTKAKEMLARMIVETGTSTFYKALSRYAKELEEDILAKIAHNISKDEIYHYEIFYENFNFYNKTEKLKKREIVKVIYDRFKEIDGEDVKIAFKALYESKFKKYDENLYNEHKKDLQKFAKKYYPYNMAIKMLLKPFHFNNIVEKSMIPVIRNGLKIVGL